MVLNYATETIEIQIRSKIRFQSVAKIGYSDYPNLDPDNKSSESSKANLNPDFFFRSGYPDLYIKIF